MITLPRNPLKRSERPDQQGALFRALEARRVGARDRKDDPHALEHLGAAAQLRAGRVEIGVGDGSAITGAALDRHLGAQRDELLDGLGNGRAARLARALLQDRDFHEAYQ